MTEASITKHLRIAGRVQGVGYRAGFAREAQRLQLSGWVRNRRDGTVEALVAGSASTVDAIVTWAMRGPPSARVDEVHISDRFDTELATTTFTVAPTE